MLRSLAAVALVAAVSMPPWEITLAPPGEPGPPLVIEGTLLALPDSTPVRDAEIRAYQQDVSGHYLRNGEPRPHLDGTLRTNVLGQFRIHTVLPGAAEGFSHVHFEIRGAGIAKQMQTVGFCRRVGAGSDSAFAKLPWMLTLPVTPATRVPAETRWAYADPASPAGYRVRTTLYVRLAPPRSD
ncbi:MAG TPA: hypothetical protein VI504_12635 [Candidatus Eisenbacteria bacterium]|jgi:hypothetical protein